MHAAEILRDLTILFAAAVIVAALFRRIHLPPIAGYIVAGVLVGPGVLRVVPDPAKVEVLAEVGVILLLFGVGLEISLDRIQRMWRAVIVGGSIQVGITMGCVFLLALPFGIEFGEAILLGFVVAISSTAIVVRGLDERGELDAPHGRIALGILVFQDLAVVPMMLLIPVLTGEGGLGGALLALGKSALLLLIVLAFARLLVPRGLAFIARTRQRDLFLLAVAVVCLGIAWIGSLLGLSLALGAFLAGMVVAGSEFRQQALSELVPLREVLVSFFFLSVGMLLDPDLLLEQPLAVLSVFVGLVVGKTVIITGTVLLLRLPLRVALLAGTALAQVGEFAFVMIHATREAGVGPLPGESILLTAAILSMFITPMLLAAGPKVAAGALRIVALHPRLGIRVTTDAGIEPPTDLTDHVIIAGYGFAGRALAKALRAAEVPYAILDLNVDNVRDAAAAGEPAFFGDVTSTEVLHHLHPERARALVVVVSEPGAAERAIRAARTLAPDLPVLVRTRWASDTDILAAAGATEVVSAEQEGTARLLDLALRRIEAPPVIREEALAELRRLS